MTDLAQGPGGQGPAERPGSAESLGTEELPSAARESLTPPPSGPLFAKAQIRPHVVDTELPAWPLVGMIMLFPLWWVLGLAGFMWIVLAVPMAVSLVQRRDLMLPKGFGFWLLFLAAVCGSVFSIDGVARLAGWSLRFGYYIAATIVFLYILNGGRSVSQWKVIRLFTFWWIFTVAGGYLAFVLGDFGFNSPMAYLMPAPLLENDLINTLVTPSFADLQNIIGFDVPRPKAPFNYTNSWGAMLGLLTPFAFIALREPRVGFDPRLIRIVLGASVIPAVVSLNRGLWLSLGIGLIYGAVRFGIAGESAALFRLMIAAAVLAATIALTPLGGLIATRIDTGHSNGDRTELALDAIDGAIERPIFGWGAPRPNDRNLPSVGTHGMTWFVMFSYGFVGFAGYFGFLANLALRSFRQKSPSGVWANVVLAVAVVQTPFYLHVPNQLFTLMAAGAVALRLQASEDDRTASSWA